MDGHNGYISPQGTGTGAGALSLRARNYAETPLVLLTVCGRDGLLSLQILNANRRR